MKYMRCIILLLLINVSFESFAEYNKCELEVTFSLVDNSEVKIFFSFSGFCDSDSVKSFTYLKRMFLEGNVLDEKNVLHGCKKRYDCCGEYVYFDFYRISFDSIKAAEVNSVFNGSFMSGIVTNVTIADTSWFIKKPMKRIEFKGAHAEYTIYVFERNKRLNELVGLFKREYQKWSLTDELMDDELNSILKELDSYRVVVTYFGGGC